LPTAVVLGIAGGMLGSFFVSINFKMAKIRKQCLTTKWIKPIETFMWAFVTASCFFWVPYIVGTCSEIDDDVDAEDLFKGWCPLNKQFNGLATLFWNTEGGVIRAIMDNKINIPIIQQLSFFAVWYFFTITTYGTNVPAGLFLPGMIIGCIMGDIYSTMVQDLNILGSDFV